MKRPDPRRLPVPTRPTQPMVARASQCSTSGATFSDGWRSITPLMYGAVCVGLQRPPLLRLPVEAPARDRAHGVDDLAAVGEGEDDGLVAVAVDAQLDVVDGVGFAHGRSG